METRWLTKAQDDTEHTAVEVERPRVGNYTWVGLKSGFVAPGYSQEVSG